MNEEEEWVIQEFKNLWEQIHKIQDELNELWKAKWKNET